MKYINELLDSELFGDKEISRLRSQIDGSLVNFSSDEIFTQLICLMAQAKEGEICVEEDNNNIMYALLDFMVATILVDAYDRRRHPKF